MLSVNCVEINKIASKTTWDSKQCKLRFSTVFFQSLTASTVLRLVSWVSGSIFYTESICSFVHTWQ